MPTPVELATIGFVAEESSAVASTRDPLVAEALVYDGRLEMLKALVECQGKAAKLPARPSRGRAVSGAGR